MFVWPFTGFINHDDESEHGNICEVDEDLDDDDGGDGDVDAKNRTGEAEEHIKEAIFINRQPRIGLKFVFSYWY